MQKHASQEIKPAVNEAGGVYNAKLVSAPRLLEELFDPESRPSLRTVRNWTAAKAIPFVRLGHLVFFNIPDVQRALEKRHTIMAKGGR